MKRLLDCTRASITIVVALLMPVLIGMAALAFDVSNFYVIKNRLQTAADAAALAAAQSIQDPTTATKVAMQLSALNVGGGYGSVTTASDVVLGQYNSGTKTFVPSVAPFNAIQVTAARDSSHANAPSWLLASIFGAKAVDIQAKAVASLSQGACMIALDPKSTQTFLVSGMGTVSVPNCGIYVDSSDANALYQSGNGGVSALDINVVGNYYASGTYSPAPKTKRPYLADPLAYLPEPVPGPCTYTNQDFNGNAKIPDGSVICGSTSFRGSVTFGPGIVYFANAQVKFASNVIVTGNAVTLYLDANTTWDSTGSGSFSLTAPSTGTYTGIAIFGSRSGPVDTMNWAGGRDFSIMGTVYLPRDIFSMYGSTDGTVTDKSGYVIAWRFKYEGNASFVFDSFGASMPAGLSAAAISLVL